MTILGIGTDLIECQRIADIVGRHGDRFMQRMLTDSERAYMAEKADPTPHIAGRFAAKEAILKVLGTGWRGPIAWTDMEISNDPNGRPLVALTGACREIAARCGIAQILISISHTRSYATATAIALGA